MKNKTATNSTGCDYCGGQGYFEIHNAYDPSEITIEICDKCTTTNFGQKDTELN